MGILNLLPNLKSITHETHISAYSGQRVAIDMYVWIHQALYICAIEVFTKNDFTPLISVIEKRINVFLSYGIDLLLVFDGDQLPSKLSIEKTREANREKCIKEAQEYLANGNRYAANNLFARGIDVTPEMAHAVIKMAREKGIECIVAPYEADSQLAYLSKIGYVDVVVTVDSDLLAFGAKRVLFKMDNDFHGEEICLADLPQNTQMNFKGWTHDMFLTCCILAGCDYLENLKYVGFKKVQGQMASVKCPKSVLNSLIKDKKYCAPPDFEEKFEKAYLSFKFQRVFCPIRKKMVTMSDWDIDQMRLDANSLEDYLKENPEFEIGPHDKELIKALWKVKDIEFVGKKLPKEVICGIAYGFKNPTTKCFFEGESEVKEPKVTQCLGKTNKNTEKKTIKTNNSCPSSQGFEENENENQEQVNPNQDKKKKQTSIMSFVRKPQVLTNPNLVSSRNDQKKHGSFLENSKEARNAGFSEEEGETSHKTSPVPFKSNEGPSQSHPHSIPLSKNEQTVSEWPKETEIDRKSAENSQKFNDIELEKIVFPKKPEHPIVSEVGKSYDDCFFSRSSTATSETQLTSFKITNYAFSKTFKKIKQSHGSSFSPLGLEIPKKIEINQDEEEKPLEEGHKMSEMLSGFSYKPPPKRT